jgi:hypothetical protein
MLVRTTGFGPIANLFHSRVSRADKLGSGDRTWTGIARRRRRDRCSGWCANGRDLGYWVGYRIVKSYYQHANDKRRALRENLQMTDPKAFLAKSGWYPGIQIE